LLVLVFHTGATAPGFGFTGSITALLDERNDFNSSNFIYTNASAFTMSYPESGFYLNNELSTFVYAPNSQGNIRTNRAEISVIELEDSCRDKVNIFLFSEAGGTGGVWFYDRR